MFRIHRAKQARRDEISVGAFHTKICRDRETIRSTSYLTLIQTSLEKYIRLLLSNWNSISYGHESLFFPWF